jgi:hypothetical protein
MFCHEWAMLTYRSLSVLGCHPDSAATGRVPHRFVTKPGPSGLQGERKKQPGRCGAVGEGPELWNHC